MNIAMLTYWSCPRTRLGVLTAGGMNVYLIELTNNLAKLGHTVYIFTRHHHETEDYHVEFHENVKLIHLTQHTEDAYSGAEQFAEKVRQHLIKNDMKIDVIHSHYYYSGIAALALRKSLHIPVFQTFHTLAVMKEMYAGVNDKNRVEVERTIIANADGVFANTEYEKKEQIEYYGADKSKITVISPGVDHEVFKPHDKFTARHRLKISLHKKIILFVGRIDPVKGLTTLTDAVSQLVQTKPKFEDSYQVLLIGGDINSRTFWRSPEVKRIVERIDKKQLGCCIKFIGSKPHHELPWYYSAADVVVMPSVYESFGLVVLEAMASGGYVLASRVGGLKYLIDDKKTGRLFESGNSDDLAKTLWEMLEHTEERESIRQSALAYSQDFCWDKQAVKIVNAYKAVK